jgi:flagellar assembly factor FliW
MTMTITCARFGSIEYTPEDVVTLPEGLLGFPSHREYLIINHKDGSSFRWLQSVDDPKVAFLVTDPANIAEDYAPAMPKGLAENLDLAEETPRIVYAIVSIPPGKPQEMTVNLAGPIVINAEKRIAQQVVVEDPQWSTKHRMIPEPQAEAAA